MEFYEILQNSTKSCEIPWNSIDSMEFQQLVLSFFLMICSGIEQDYEQILKILEFLVFDSISWNSKDFLGFPRIFWDSQGLSKSQCFQFSCGFINVQCWVSKVLVRGAWYSTGVVSDLVQGWSGTRLLADNGLAVSALGQNESLGQTSVSEKDY